MVIRVWHLQTDTVLVQSIVVQADWVELQTEAGSLGD